MRALCIILIVFFCAFFGMYLGQLGKRKIRFLLDFKRILILLKGEIRYGITPIGQACFQVSKRTEGALRDFLEELSKGVQKKSKDSFAEIWEIAAKKYLPKQYMTQEEWNMLLQIGGAIGYLDTSMQLHNFDFFMEQIDHSLATCRIKQEKDKKLYQTLGISIGLMIAIVLI